MKITKRQLRRIIKEEVSRVLSESNELAYDRAYAKYDEISDMHSMTDGTNALAKDLTDDQYNQMDGHTQDLDWDDQLAWINDNHPEWLKGLLADKKTEVAPETPEQAEKRTQKQIDQDAVEYFDQLLSKLGLPEDSKWQALLANKDTPDGIIALAQRAIHRGGRSASAVDPSGFYWAMMRIMNHNIGHGFIASEPDDMSSEEWDARKTVTQKVLGPHTRDVKIK